MGKKKTIRKLRAKLAKARARAAAPADAAPADGPVISPLAPASFPVLAPVEGVALAATAAGVRYKDRVDVMLARLVPGSAVAGVFTRSRTRAAPVLWCEKALAARMDGGPVGILVNAGNANAFTGGAGMTAVEETTGAVARALGTDPLAVFPASTGVIGEPLPHGRIVAVIDGLAEALNDDAWADAARAIMTTDTFPKGSTATAEIDGAPVTISGFAKGSGMIAPDMATMLVYIFTDANIDGVALQAMLTELTDRTFNAITVDGDTSTSDTLVLGATRRAAHEPVLDPHDPRVAGFHAALHRVMRDLAHQVVRDGEGATKFVEIAVTGAESDADAKRVAMSIANSPLVKTAFAGEDPNWGRIVMAVGKSGAAAERDRLSIRFGDITVAENGAVAGAYKEADGADYMRGQELSVTVDLGLGAGTFTAWTCDFTDRYISINADYRS